MTFPITRMRRLRKNPGVRRMVRENVLTSADLMAPLFLVPGTGVKKEISSLPGQYHLSSDTVVEKAQEFFELGIPAVLLFGLPKSKDDRGSAACQSDGVVQEGVAKIKRAVPELLVVTDLCFCEYTSHGHCGIINNGHVDNDATLEIIVEQTLSHARAGADIIAPSGMIDGTVQAMRQGLDQAGFNELPIMAYAAKYASGFYGPFREAVNSSPEFGDRKSYQMDPANIREALREVELDIEEGADIVMVKPALSYLDVLQAVKETFGMPTAAYSVSGEFAMVKAAAAKGWINEAVVRDEMLLSMKRAGADILITYFAEDVARSFRDS